jgi:hypothetical protein
MHLEDGILHVVLWGLFADGRDHAHPQILRQADLAHARLYDLADALIVSRLVKQDRQIGLERDLEQRAGFVAEFSGNRAPDIGAVPLMR